MLPDPTPRLRFREMEPRDLDRMESLLGDPVVMRFYPAPKSREEASRWIAWNRKNYADHGHGLWIIETDDGAFVGDCGLTWQEVKGTPKLEVGYHVRAELHGRGYASEAAAACRDFARDRLRASELVAIIHPDNVASRRVAKNIGMSRIGEDHGGSLPVRVVLGMTLS
ncbi:GNAT family N-acetyltransferase [Citricoccus nitrophenolicus]|uniref:GNAT family N-acetyltransferase n=1 Tax=Citricoccus nitrophenolicus TaxID=863575 RepID=UPI0039B50799